MPTVSTTSPSCGSNFERSASDRSQKSQLEQALLALPAAKRERGGRGLFHVQVSV